MQPDLGTCHVCYLGEFCGILLSQSGAVDVVAGRRLWLGPSRERREPLRGVWKEEEQIVPLSIVDTCRSMPRWLEKWF